jgi:hypothetical protein
MRGRGAGGLKPSDVDMERLRVVDTGRGRWCAGFGRAASTAMLSTERARVEEDGEEATAVARALARGHGGARTAATEQRARERRKGARRGGEASDALWYFIRARGRAEARGYGVQPWWGALWCMESAWQNDEHVVGAEESKVGCRFGLALGRIRTRTKNEV